MTAHTAPRRAPTKTAAPRPAARPHTPQPTRNTPVTARRVPVLPVLAVAFCLAAIVRLGAGLGAAFAQGTNLPTAAPGLPVESTAGSLRLPATEAIESRAAAELLVAVTLREEALRTREAELSVREERLAVAAAGIEAQIAALRDSEDALAATMALAERAAEDDIDRMVGVFESMKPDEAALVFAEMDPGFAAGFLARLSPEAAGAILAGLDPRLAYQLSALVAGRNTGVPRR